MITNEPVMYFGNWSIEPDSHRTTIFTMFGDKFEGKIRVFMYKGSNNYFSDLIPEADDQQGVNRTLDSMSGRVVFYNGQHRDTEIDLTFSVDTLLDSL